MLNYQVKIGLAPMRRDVTPRPGIFNWEKAEERGRAAVEYIEKHFASENVSFVDLKGINPVDVMYCEADAEKVIERFNQEKVDAVFIINSNFGNEEIAAQVARGVGKPVCIWAPIDTSFLPDGTRYTDSQCGLFGVSRQLQRFHVPFSYIETCAVESDTFAEGFRKFASVSCMVKNFTGMRIAQVGMRPKPFCSVIFNEGELMEKFGIKIIPINFAIIEQRMRTAEMDYADEIAEYEQYFLTNYELDDLTPKYIKPMATMTAMYKHLFEEFNLDVLSAECWTATPVMFDGLAPCALYGLLNEMGFMVSCESDIHCAMTMALLKCATLGKGRPLFGEFTVRHPENRNAELLWHCGPFPVSEMAEGTKARLVNQRAWLRGRDGEYTVARIDQEHGDYMVLPLICRTTEGPQTHGTYIWGEFENLQAVEDRLLDGPYIHHFVEMRGDYRKEIKEFCKYFPNLKVDETIK